MRMSLDGLSQNNTQLNVSAPSRHPGKIDAFVRRSAVNDPSSPGARYRVVGSADTSSAPRRYPRYVPAANISQCLLDLTLIGGSQVIVLSLIYSRLALVGP